MDSVQLSDGIALHPSPALHGPYSLSQKGDIVFKKIKDAAITKGVEKTTDILGDHFRTHQDKYKLAGAAIAGAVVGALLRGKPVNFTVNVNV